MSSSTTSGQSHVGSARRRRVWGRIGSTIAILLLFGIIGAFYWLGTTTPIEIVATPSMVPTLHVGDVVLVERLRRPPQVGDIVEAPVPLLVQQQFRYPPAVTHRIVKIKNGRITTKGDANSAPDPFDVPISQVHRHLVTVLPWAGRLLGFITSPFGLIWLVFGVVLLFGPALLEALRGPMPVGAGIGDSLALQELIAAVNDYGVHLKTHTAILHDMAGASRQLSSVASRLEASLGLPAEPAAPTPDVDAAPEADVEVAVEAAPETDAEAAADVEPDPWEQSSDLFEVGMAALVAFASEHGHVDVPEALVAADRFPLGLWLVEQQDALASSDCAAERRERLVERGVQPKPRPAGRWRGRLRRGRR